MLYSIHCISTTVCNTVYVVKYYFQVFLVSLMQNSIQVAKKRQGTTSEAAKRLKTEGDGGFVPRVKLAKLTVALAADGRFSWTSL